MSTTTLTCPVCGAGPELQNGQALQNCPSCATPSAFAVYFASEEAYQTWLADMNSRKAAIRNRNLRQLRGRCSLIVGPESLALHDAQEESLLLFNQYGQATTQTKVRQYSVSNLHQILLKSTGTVAASGDVGSQQGQLTGRKNIKAVLAAPRCTYLVNKDGTVCYCGVCAVANEIAGWRDIKSLVCGKDHVVGLREDGTVVLADSRSRDARGTEQWRNVKSVAAAFDYTLALHENGTVSYAGPKEDMAQEVAQWKNIAAIAADDQYAVGLTEDGQVLLAGKANKVLDGGRSEARNWKNMVCIGAGTNVIAGLTEDGELLLAGFCMYRDAVVSGFRAQKPLQQ